METLYLLCAISILITGFTGIYVNKQKNRSSLEGFLFGFLGSIIGLIILALLPNKKQKSMKNKKNIPTKESIRRAKQADTRDNVLGYILLVGLILLIILLGLI